MKWSLEIPPSGFCLVEGKHPVLFALAHVSSFDLLAYERDNQHQDEAEEDPENGHKPRGQGLQEADPDSDADVSVLSSGHDTWKPTDRELAGLPHTRPLAPDTPVIPSAQEEGGLHHRM